MKAKVYNRCGQAGQEVRNQTQIRDQKTGAFIRRVDDGAVTKSVSRSELFHIAMQTARERRIGEIRRRLARNNLAAITAKN
jgi:hypothetical protein